MRTTEREDHQTRGPPNVTSTKRNDHQTRRPPNTRSTKREVHQTRRPPNTRSTKHEDHRTQGAPNVRTTKREIHQMQGPPNEPPWCSQQEKPAPTHSLQCERGPRATPQHLFCQPKPTRMQHLRRSEQEQDHSTGVAAQDHGTGVAAQDHSTGVTAQDHGTSHAVPAAWDATFSVLGKGCPRAHQRVRNSPTLCMTRSFQLALAVPLVN